MKGFEMKTLIAFFLAIVILLTTTAADLPPQLPAVVYGNAYMTGTVNVTVNGVLVASTQAKDYIGQIAYVVKIPTEGIPCGTWAKFQLGTVEIMRRICPGVSQQLDLFAKVYTIGKTP